MGNENIADEVARLAYELWEKDGYMPGRDLENWFEAERIVLMKRKGRSTLEKKSGKTILAERMPVELKKTSAREMKKETPEKKGASKKTATRAKSPKEGRRTK